MVTQSDGFCHWNQGTSENGKCAKYKKKFCSKLFASSMEYIGQIGWHIELGSASSNMPTYLTNIFHIGLNSIL